MESGGAPPCASSSAKLTARGTSTNLSRSNSLTDPDVPCREGEDYFFGFCALSACFMTKDLTRPNSFWNPLAKSCVPYSKSTMKLKVKKTKRANQNSPRSKAMEQMES